MEYKHKRLWGTELLSQNLGEKMGPGLRRRLIKSSSLHFFVIPLYQLFDSSNAAVVDIWVVSKPKSAWMMILDCKRGSHCQILEKSPCIDIQAIYIGWTYTTKGERLLQDNIFGKGLSSFSKKRMNICGMIWLHELFNPVWVLEDHIANEWSKFLTDRVLKVQMQIGSSP